MEEPIKEKKERAKKSKSKRPRNPRGGGVVIKKEVDLPKMGPKTMQRVRSRSLNSHDKMKQMSQVGFPLLSFFNQLTC